MAGTIAQPTRGPGRADTRPGPEQLGGENGTIAEPSRLSANMGDGIPQRPGQTPNGLTGAHGPVALYRGLVTLLQPRYLPGERGMWSTRYVRQWFANMAGPMGYNASGPVPTDWTTNTVSGAGPVAQSPIPFSMRRLTRTLYQQYDQQVYARYVQATQPQANTQVRRQLAGTEGDQAPPYVNLLTRQPPVASYGLKTRVLRGPANNGS